MKIFKSQAILRLYSTLIKERNIDKKIMIKELNLSNITFNRYLAEIRSYLERYEPNYVLVYRRHNDLYVLKEKDGR